VSDALAAVRLVLNDGTGVFLGTYSTTRLAQRSAAAAKEIRELIGASVAQVESGALKVQAAGVTMQRIVDSIRHVGTTVDQIAHAATEQAGGIAQINAAVAEMDRSTQQNAALVQQAAVAPDKLKDQSRRMVESIGTLRTA
jgi:methyl-accepting chemotaxis protein